MCQGLAHIKANHGLFSFFIILTDRQKTRTNQLIQGNEQIEFGLKAELSVNEEVELLNMPKGLIYKWSKMTHTCSVLINYNFVQI